MQVHRPQFDNGRPLVSVILATKDRPRLLSMALACYEHQTYRPRELIVIDDGAVHPADGRVVEKAGGILLTVASDTALGAKLNAGVERSNGSLCQKMDDDDWYGSTFLERMVSAVAKSQANVCRPTIAFLMPFLFFDVCRWELRVSSAVAGSTLFFARDDWKHRPFRSIAQDEDTWFVADQARAGAVPLAVREQESFLAVRHRGTRQDRDHTWTHQYDGSILEDHLKKRPLYNRRPEDLLPAWAIAFYRRLHDELQADERNEAVTGANVDC
jgi:glycosyltransferase involved in cell wall biosynthesis